MQPNNPSNSNSQADDFDAEAINRYLLNKFGINAEQAEQLIQEASQAKQQEQVQEVIRQLASEWQVTEQEAERRVNVANQLFVELPPDKQELYSGIEGVQLLHARAARTMDTEKQAMQVYAQQQQNTPASDSSVTPTPILGRASTQVAANAGNARASKYSLQQLVDMDEKEYVANQQAIMDAFVDGSVTDDIPALRSLDPSLIPTNMFHSVNY